MRIPTPDQWRFEGLAESLVDMLRREPERIVSGEWLKEILLNAFDHVYAWGRIDPETTRKRLAEGFELGVKTASPIIPVIDLTHLPEILERVKERKGHEPW